MNAKHLYKFLSLLLIMTMTSLHLSADSGSSQNQNPPANGSALLENKSQNPKLKRIPSKNILELIYSDGMLILYSESYQGVFELSLENCNTLECYEIHSVAIGEPIIINLTSGEYNVTAEDSEGRLFTGVLIL